MNNTSNRLAANLAGSEAVPEATTKTLHFKRLRPGDKIVVEGEHVPMVIENGSEHRIQQLTIEVGEESLARLDRSGRLKRN